MPDLNKEFPSQWLKVNVDVKNGDTLTFTDAGKVTTDGVDDKGNPKRRLDIHVKVDKTGVEKSMTINATNRKRLVKSWGENTDNWVGKTAEVIVEKKTNPRSGELVDSISLIAAGKYADGEADF